MARAEPPEAPNPPRPLGAGCSSQPAYASARASGPTAGTPPAAAWPLPSALKPDRSRPQVQDRQGGGTGLRPAAHVSRHQTRILDRGRPPQDPRDPLMVTRRTSPGARGCHEGGAAPACFHAMGASPSQHRGPINPIPHTSSGARGSHRRLAAPTCEHVMGASPSPDCVPANPSAIIPSAPRSVCLHSEFDTLHVGVPGRAHGRIFPGSNRQPLVAPKPNELAPTDRRAWTCTATAHGSDTNGGAVLHPTRRSPGGQNYPPPPLPVP